MNNKFSRALSSVLAFVMLLSCMMVVNVSSVLAADVINSSMTIKRTDNANYVTVNNDQNTSDAWKVAKYNDKKQPGWIKFTLGKAANVAITTGGEKVIYVGDTLGSTTANLTLTSGTKEGNADFDAGTYYIYNNSGNITISEIVITISGETSSTTTTTTTTTTTESTTEATTATVTEESSTETTTAESSGGDTPSTGKVTFEAVLNANDLTDDWVGLNGSKVIDANNYFKAIHNANGAFGVSAVTNTSIKLSDGNTIDFTKAIADDSGNATRRAISFKTGSTEGEVYVYAQSSSTSARTLTLVNDLGTKIGAGSAPSTKDGTYESVFTVPANTTCILYSSGKCNLFYIGSTVPLAEFVTYKVQISPDYDSTTYPAVTFDPTTTEDAAATITATWSANDTYLAGSTTFKLTDSVATFDDKTNTYNIMPVTTGNDAWFKQIDMTKAVKVYNGTKNVGSFDTIKEAVAAAADGYVITVKAGTYNEKLTIDKAVTIKSESGSNDVIIANNGGAQTTLGANSTVTISTSGVTLENLTIKNTYNLKGEANALSQTPALTIGGTSYGNTINNCKLVSVQDTLLIQDNKVDNTTDSRAVFTNCRVTGGTDFVCGTGLVTFNDCTFNVALYKYDSNRGVVTDNQVYVFAPTPFSKFVVNGGSIAYDTEYNGVSADFNAPPSSKIYYARIWDKSSMNAMTGFKDGENIELYLNGVSSIDVNKTSQSMNGFYCKSINGNIPVTAAWLNIYDAKVASPDNTNYSYSTHDANLFDYKGVLMVDNKLVIYGDFIAGTGTGTGKDGKEDPVLATVEKLGILVDSETYDADKAVETTYVFNKLVNGTDAICNGNPYTTFCVIDFTGTDLATSSVNFKLRTFTKYTSTDDYNVSNESWTVSVNENGANVTAN